jgi:hypothetical protein
MLPGLIWLRIVPLAGCYEVCNEFSDSIHDKEFLNSLRDS